MNFIIFLLIFINLLLAIIRYAFDASLNETAKTIIFTTQVLINSTAILYYFYNVLTEISTHPTQFTQMQEPIQQPMQQLNETISSTPLGDQPLLQANVGLDLLKDLLTKGKVDTKKILPILLSAFQSNPEMLTQLLQNLI